MKFYQADIIFNKPAQNPDSSMIVMHVSRIDACAAKSLTEARRNFEYKYRVENKDGWDFDLEIVHLRRFKPSPEDAARLVEIWSKVPWEQNRWEGRTIQE